MYKISLDLNSFQCLVSGGIVTIKNEDSNIIAEISLQDIGYEVMQATIKNLLDGLYSEKPIKYPDTEIIIEDRLSELKKFLQ